jgi:hypothetical protein
LRYGFVSNLEPRSSERGFFMLAAATAFRKYGDQDLRL